jgi:hypothetical protein
MKISIKGNAQVKPEARMELRLEQLGDWVILVGTDARGIDFRILQITGEGIGRYCGFDLESGWPIDKSGKIHLIGEQ